MNVINQEDWLDEVFNHPLSAGYPTPAHTLTAELPAPSLPTTFPSHGVDPSILEEYRHLHIPAPLRSSTLNPTLVDDASNMGWAPGLFAAANISHYVDSLFLRMRKYAYRQEPPRNEDGKMMCNFSEACASLTFDRKVEWNKHMGKHERPYKCTEPGCEKIPGFTYSGGLMRHQREHHSKHGGSSHSLSCPFPSCGSLEFRGKHELERHTRIRHSEDEPSWKQRFAVGDGDSPTARPQAKGEVRIFEIPGLIGNHHVEALGDYGAKRNFMRASFAADLGLEVDHSSVSDVTVGSGKVARTTGVAKAAFRFKGEGRLYLLIFHLLPDCIHNVILGKAFIKATETFSKPLNFLRRVKKTLLKGFNRFHLLYLGADSPKFDGFLAGIPQAALADTGAKVPIIDEDWARSIGLPISRGPKHRERLVFADNSKAWTSGMAYDVEWSYGREGDSTPPQKINFHILKNAPARVILCDTFLFDTEAFSRYQDFLIDDEEDDDDDSSSCFAIDIDTTSRSQGNAGAHSATDLAFIELVRRGKADDRIQNLPNGEQAAARLAEAQRRAEWDQNMARIQANQLQSPVPTANPNPRISSTAAANPTVLKRFKRLFSKRDC